MPTSYSPIDESSYSDGSMFDAEAILNQRQRSEYVDSSSEASAQTTQPAPRQAAAPQEPTVEPRQQAQATAAASASTTVINTQKQKQSAASKSWKILRDSRTAMFIGLVLVAFAAYTLLVSISYFANIGNDQSAIINDDMTPEMIKNAGGPFGAWVAHNLIHNWLGIGSFILIYYLAVCGLSLLNVYRPKFWSLTLNCLLTAISISVVTGLITYELSSPIYWGGRHGHFLNERLILFTGIWGALGVSVIMVGMVIILYLTKLKTAFGYMSEKYSAYKERQAIRHAERERIEAEEEAKRAAEQARIDAEQARINAEQAHAAEQARTEAEQAHAAEQARINAEQAHAAEQTCINAEQAHAAEQTTMAIANNHIATAAEPIAENTEVIPTISNQISASDKTADEFVEETVDDLPPLFINNTTKSAKEAKTAIQSPINQEEAIVENYSTELYDPRAELSHYEFPDIDLLKEAEDKGISVDVQEMDFNKRRITETLRHYGVEISHIEATIGPTVTLYEIIPAEGVRTRSVKSLGDDLQLSLAALGVRIIAPIPAKGTIGIEVPNKDPQVVSMRSVLESDVFRNSKMELPMALGRTISNEIFMYDLAKLPHLLVAGATGMGKSVGLNAIIASLLYKKHPSELKFVLIDPKRVELSLYRKLERHYLAALPGEDAIITDMTKVVAVLNSLCVEMDNRLTLLEQAGVRNIKEYNEKFKARRLNPEKHHFLPYIVLIIDEFADLIIRQGKEIENPVSRLAAVARAAGIHLIIATQRPTVNVITGGIKLNIPGRIAFRVIQGNDSRTILDQLGANQLIGRGDMLFSINGKLERVQCAFIDTPEVSNICDKIASQVGYSQPYELPEYVVEGEGGTFSGNIGDRDPLFDEAARYVVSSDTASTSSLQRRYSIGYNRAGKIMDQMEAAGIVGPSQGGKPRQVLVDIIMLESILENK